MNCDDPECPACQLQAILRGLKEADDLAFEDLLPFVIYILAELYDIEAKASIVDATQLAPTTETRH